MKTTACLTFVFLCCTALLAQSGPAQGSTDQKYPDIPNTLHMAAAYTLGLSYNERGYMGAQVEVTQQDGKDVFTVKPGPLYHVKSVTVTGLPEKAMTDVMQDAPKTGDVYSAARVNDWLLDVKKRFQVRGQNLKVRQEGHLDQTSASVNVMIAFQE